MDLTGMAIVAVPVLLGALIMLGVFRQMGQAPLAGALAGALAVLTGQLIFLISFLAIAHATLPLLLLYTLPVLVGAAVAARAFHGYGRSPLLGAMLGTAAAAAGVLVATLPLDFCTFAPDRNVADAIIGITLILVGVAVAVLGVLWLGRLGMAPGAALPPGLAGEESSQGQYRGFLTPMLLLLPTLVILAAFLYYPSLDTFRLSTQLTRLGAPRSIFRCVDNFTNLLNVEHFDLLALGLLLALINIAVISYVYGAMALWRRWLLAGSTMVILLVFLGYILADNFAIVLFNTFFIAGLTVVLGLAIGLAIAYLAFQPVRGANIYRTLLIWPYAISPAVAGIIFFVMFDPVAGVINHVLELFGGEGLDWLRDPWLARIAIILASVWKTLGFNILFYVAGLQNVPTNLIEAAAIDGANAWQRFQRIILPILSPITFFLIVTNISYAFFDIFGTIDYLTRGGPTGATSVMIFEVIRVGIRSGDLGKGAALSIVLFILVIGLTYVQFRTTGRRVNYGA
jgi:sn-glycerol 3-phosphate transport system permease protein